MKLKKVLIILLVILVIVGICVGAFFIIQDNLSSSRKDKSSKETEETVDEDTEDLLEWVGTYTDGNKSVTIVLYSENELYVMLGYDIYSNWIIFDEIKGNKIVDGNPNFNDDIITITKKGDTLEVKHEERDGDAEADYGGTYKKEPVGDTSLNGIYKTKEDDSTLILYKTDNDTFYMTYTVGTQRIIGHLTKEDVNKYVYEGTDSTITININGEELNVVGKSSEPDDTINTIDYKYVKE